MRLHLLALALVVPIALAVGALAVSPQSQDATVVQQDVRRANDALYSGDVDTLLRYTHPRIIELMGGEQKTRETLKESLKVVREMRVEKLSFPDAPRFFEGQDNFFVFVPTLTIVMVKGQRIESLNFQLGIKKKGQENWAYVEGSRINDSNVRSLFPDFPPGIEFPKFYRRKL